MSAQIEAEVPFHNLCALLFHQNRFQEIDKLCTTFEADAKSSVAVKELAMARFYMNWAQALERMEKYPTAVEKLRKALLIQENVRILIPSGLCNTWLITKCFNSA